MKKKTSAKIKTKQTPPRQLVAQTAEKPFDKKKIEHLSTFVREIAGEEGLRIVNCFESDGVTDDHIEKTTSMKIAEIRTVLNHLHSYGLVEYTRQKNLQTGWFTYTWKLNIDRALQNFITIKRREYEAMKSKLESGDQAQVYKCNKGCSCLEFEKALEFTFKCPGCNTKLSVMNQTEELKKLEDKLRSLNTMRNLTIETTQPLAPVQPNRTPLVVKEPTLARR